MRSKSGGGPVHCGQHENTLRSPLRAKLVELIWETPHPLLYCVTAVHDKNDPLLPKRGHQLVETVALYRIS